MSPHHQRPSRSAIRFIFVMLSLALCMTTRALSDESRRPERLLVLFGSYSPAEAPGIHAYSLDLRSGALQPLATTSGVKNPSFLAIHPSADYVYAVSEIGDFSGKPTGAVVALRLDRKTGQLERLNAQPSGGDGPCHVVVDAAGKNVLVANYGGGSVSVLPIGTDGRLGSPTCTIQHVGSSVTSRQRGPHAHSINLDAANRFAVAADLGLDKILIYRFDAERGQLTPNDPPFVKLEPGSGPRHFAFHPSGKFAYVINELNLTVTAFAYDASTGALTSLQTISTVPEGVDREGYSTAEVQVHPSGRFVYGSNRGHDTLAIFSVDAETGKLTSLGHHPTGGQTPRNFGIDPTGTFILAANQQSDNVVVLRVDPETGKLHPTGHEIKIPKPVCVKFARLAGGGR